MRKKRWIVRAKLASGVQKTVQEKRLTKHGVVDAFYYLLMDHVRSMRVSNTAHWTIGEVERV
jgi:hypothetical protein